MKRFRSVAGFTKVGLPGIWFYESPDIYVYEFFSFGSANILQPILWYPEINALQQKYDAMHLIW